MDRRTEIRIPYPARAEGFLHNQAFSCELRDLSASGALLLPTVEMKRGQFLRLHLKLPSLEEVVDVDAVVVRETIVDGRSAVAIEFHGLTPRAETLLRTYIEWERQRRPTPTPPRPVPAVTAPPRSKPTSSAMAPARPGTGPGHPAVKTGPGHPVVKPGTGPGHPVVRPGTGPGHPVVRPPSSSGQPVARPPTADSLAQQAELRTLYKMALGEIEK